MDTIATIGLLVRVTPWDDVQIVTPGNSEFVDDRSPFVFRVEGKLEDGQLFYGLYGPVISGPERYQNLICTILIRADGTDWRKTSRCQANFKVGPSGVVRDHRFDFRHPEGTSISGFPLICRFGEICVIPSGA